MNKGIINKKMRNKKGGTNMFQMFSKSLNKAKNQKGFTLVELIVVIAILGILAGMGIGKFGGFTDKAKVNADFATAATIASAAQAYMADQPGINKQPTMKDLAGANLIEKEEVIAQSTGRAFTIRYDAKEKKLTVRSGSTIFFPKSDYDSKGKSETSETPKTSESET